MTDFRGRTPIPLARPRTMSAIVAAVLLGLLIALSAVIGVVASMLVDDMPGFGTLLAAAVSAVVASGVVLTLARKRFAHRQTV